MHRADRPLRTARPASARSRLLRIWVASTAIVFLFGLLWSLATPVGAAPDEPTQIVKAAAVARGELVGTSTSARPTADVDVRVPASFATDSDLATCYAGRATVPAGCAPQLSDASTLVVTPTYVGRNPPLYYLLVGAPTLLWHSNFAVYVMRLLGVAWSALLLGLALAIAALWSRAQLLVVAVAVVVTPMVLFLAAVVNPSGLEIAAAVATWTCGLVLLEHSQDPPPELVLSCGVAASVLVLCLALDPLWLAIIALTLVALSPRVVTDLWGDPLARRWLGIVAACGVAAVAFIVGAHTLVVAPVGAAVAPHASTVAVIAEALGRTGGLLRQSVGVFGWLDTPSPVAVLIGWWMAVAVVVTFGLVTSRWRRAGVLAALIAAAVAVPTALMVSQAHHDGLVWQARDGMALYVGIPLVAAAITSRAREGRHLVIDNRAREGPDATDTWEGPDATGTLDSLGPRALRRLTTLMIVGVAIGQLADFAWTLRRYTVGLGPTLNPLVTVPGGWSPPVPALWLLVAAALTAGAYGWWIRQLAAVTYLPER